MEFSVWYCLVESIALHCTIILVQRVIIRKTFHGYLTSQLIFCPWWHLLCWFTMAFKPVQIENAHFRTIAPQEVVDVHPEYLGYSAGWWYSPAPARDQNIITFFPSAVILCQELHKAFGIPVTAVCIHDWVSPFPLHRLCVKTYLLFCATNKSRQSKYQKYE